MTDTRTTRPSRSTSGRISMTSLTTSTYKFSTACYPEVRNRNRVRSLNTGASVKRTARFGRPSGTRRTWGTYGSTGFVDPAECASTIVTAMTALAETQALIIDLRETAGGGKAGSTPLLESYLFDRRTHLSDVRFRYTGETRERWTLDSVAGARFGGEKPVYVLTSAHTLSAGEELAYDLQALKRATIVGETTSGQAHATFEARIENH